MTQNWLLLCVGLVAAAVAAVQGTQGPARRTVVPSGHAQRPPAACWQPATPHGYVAAPLAAVRRAPGDRAPVVFYLKGGVRVAIPEQTDEWWRVSYAGKSGWVRSSQIQPHVDLAFIDLRTGKVVRRIATMGDEGDVTDWRYAYAATTVGPGLSRTSLTARSHVDISRIPVENPTFAGVLDSGMGRMVAVLKSPDDTAAPVTRIDLASGRIERYFPTREMPGSLKSLGKGAILCFDNPDVGEGPHTAFLRTWEGRMVRSLGKMWAPDVSADGTGYGVAAADGGRSLGLYQLTATRPPYLLGTIPGWMRPDQLLVRNATACLGLATQEGWPSTNALWVDLRNWRVRRIHLPADDSEGLLAIDGHVLYVEDGDPLEDAIVYRIDLSSGRVLDRWSYPSGLAETNSRNLWVMAGRHAVTVRNIHTGSVVLHIHPTWRPPRYLRYSPHQTSPDGKIIAQRAPLAVASIAISPDERWLLVAEYLQRDAGG